MKRGRDETDPSLADVVSKTKKVSPNGDEEDKDGNTYGEYKKRSVFTKLMSIQEIQRIPVALLGMVVEYVVEPFGIFVFGCRDSSNTNMSARAFYPSLPLFVHLAPIIPSNSEKPHVNHENYAAARIRDWVYVMHTDNHCGSRMVRYHIPSDSWSYEPLFDNTIFKRQHHAFLRLSDTELLIAGGLDLGGNALQDCFICDTTTNVTKVAAPMKRGKSRFASVAHQGKAYLFGGAHSRDVPTGESEVYCLETDTWSSIADLPQIKYFSYAVIANDRIFVLGGVRYDNTHTPSVHEYDPTADKWTLANWTLPRPMDVLHSHFDSASQQLFIISGGLNIYSRRFPFDAHKWKVQDIGSLPIDTSSTSCI